jgi:hypothetical protein
MNLISKFFSFPVNADFLAEFNSAKWLRHFAANKKNRPEPAWDQPIRLPALVLSPLIASLEEFQLGDGGGPASLIAHNAWRFRNASEEIRQLVDLWFAEEKEHSRLLGCAVKRFGGKRIESHWSFSAFCFCRCVFGVRFELQVLLLTEIASTAYYRLLRRHCEDAPVRAMCSLILRDEAAHIAFHLDRLAASRDAGLFSALLWHVQFFLCGCGAAAMLWVNHRKCLQAMGGSSREFFGEVFFELVRFTRRVAKARRRLPLNPFPGLSLSQTRLTSPS